MEISEKKLKQLEKFKTLLNVKQKAYSTINYWKDDLRLHKPENKELKKYFKLLKSQKERLFFILDLYGQIDSKNRFMYYRGFEIEI